MYENSTKRRTFRFAGLLAARLLIAMAPLAISTPAFAHQVWIETDSSAAVGRDHTVHVCWGHAGHKETGEMRAGQQGKLTAWVLGPGGRAGLPLSLVDDSFVARFVPAASGCYALGAVLQVGIIDRELHGIPAKTNIIMSTVRISVACARAIATNGPCTSRP